MRTLQRELRIKLSHLQTCGGVMQDLGRRYVGAPEGRSSRRPPIYSRSDNFRVPPPGAPERALPHQSMGEQKVPRARAPLAFARAAAPITRRPPAPRRRAPTTTRSSRTATAGRPRHSATWRTASPSALEPPRSRWRRRCTMRARRCSLPHAPQWPAAAAFALSHRHPETPTVCHPRLGLYVGAQPRVAALSLRRREFLSLPTPTTWSRQRSRSSRRA